MGGSRTAVASSAAAKIAVASGGSAQPAAASRRGGFVNRIWLDRQFARLAVLPTVVVMACVFGLPLLFSLYLSFQGWDPEQSLFGGRFVGLENYQDLLTDPQFIASLGITAGYTAVTVTAELAIGLGIAMLLNVDLAFIGVF